jgi:hypothetical protein
MANVGFPPGFGVSRGEGVHRTEAAFSLLEHPANASADAPSAVAAPVRTRRRDTFRLVIRSQ